MTTPPPTGRYYVIERKSDGYLYDVFANRGGAVAGQMHADDDSRDGPHRIVECVAMPRVRVRRSEVGSWCVDINGMTLAVRAYDVDAKGFARDLRRALRRK